MKHILWITIFVSALALTVVSCSPAATATPLPVIPLNTSDNSEFSHIQASGVVVPSREARLSFPISGLVEAVTVEEGDQIQAGQELVRLDTSELEYDLIAAEAALESAEIDARLQRQRKKKFDFNTFNFVYVSRPGEKILIADTNVEQMRSALEVVKASIAQGTLTAPFEGTAVEVNVSQGEYVQPAQVAVLIADLQNVWIETTDLSEFNVASLKIGQSATVYVEALDEEYLGEVTAISPISNTIGGDV
ncbi:MAG: efflux RND transporter periplasmic adaptor subunit, partial [Anaerolineales bacterium]